MPTTKISDADFNRIAQELKEYSEAARKQQAIASAEVDRRIAQNKAAGKVPAYTEEDRNAAYAAADAQVSVPAYPLDTSRHPRELINAYQREEQRRRTNATRAANAELRAKMAVQAGTYSVGETVQVHAFGHWYNGTVTKLGRTGKVTVKYTSGTGVTREKAVASNLIRKA